MESSKVSHPSYTLPPQTWANAILADQSPRFTGTYLPLQDARELARQHKVLDRLHPIFDFVPGAVTPPPAPRHASKPKQPKKPAGGLLQTNQAAKRKRKGSLAVAFPSHTFNLRYILMGVQFQHHTQRNSIGPRWPIETRHQTTKPLPRAAMRPKKMRIGSFSTRYVPTRSTAEAHEPDPLQHTMYGEALLDYYALDMRDPSAPRPEPPTNFRPDFPIDKHNNTALHWASAMGDIDGVQHMKRFGPSLSARNMRGETPLMHAVNFTNAFDKQTFPTIMDELLDTIDTRDLSGRTVLHHAVSHAISVKYRRPARYYVENILAKIQATHDPVFVELFVNAQDQKGDTAIHLAAENKNTKIIRSLLGRGASTSIRNQKGMHAEEMIRELNEGIRSRSAMPPPSSSPFAPPPPRGPSVSDALQDFWKNNEFGSEAAKAVQNRITPSILQKSKHLAQCFEDEWKEKDEAEQEARRLLANTQEDLAVQLEELRRHEALLEPDDVAAKTEAEATQLQTQVLSLMRYQNRIAIQGKIHTELSMQVNGNGNSQGGGASSQSGGGGDDKEERLGLARQLLQNVQDLRKIEGELVGATGLQGVGEAIENYRFLLQLCLGPQAPGLDDNLDSMIREFEEEADYMRGHAINGADVQVMDLSDAE